MSGIIPGSDQISIADHKVTRYTGRDAANAKKDADIIMTETSKESDMVNTLFYSMVAARQLYALLDHWLKVALSATWELTHPELVAHTIAAGAEKAVISTPVSIAEITDKLTQVVVPILTQLAKAQSEATDGSSVPGNRNEGQGGLGDDLQAMRGDALKQAGVGSEGDSGEDRPADEGSRDDAVSC